jgi:hypothetical protein
MTSSGRCGTTRISSTSSRRGRNGCSLFLAGVNPYLLFFGAIELGLTRDEYYRRISEGESDE